MFLCAADQSVRYIIPYGGSAFFIIQEVPMYQVLYRKYRPRVFADVYGQDHVTSTLKNEIKEGRISLAAICLPAPAAPAKPPAPKSWPRR